MTASVSKPLAGSGTSTSVHAWAAYLNAWIYGERTGVGQASVTRFPIWQQNHADNPPANAGAPCPNGASGRFRGLTYRLAANTTPFDGATEPIVAGHTSPSAVSRQHVYLGRATGNDSGGVPPADGAKSFQISNDGRQHYAGTEFAATIVAEGEYLAPNTASRGALGELLPGVGTSSGWQLRADPIANGQSGYGLTVATEPDGSTRLRIITGSEYINPGTVPGAYALGMTLAFQAVMDFTSCV